MRRTWRMEVERLCVDVVILDSDLDAAPSLADMAKRARLILERRPWDMPKKRKRRSARVPGSTEP